MAYDDDGGDNHDTLNPHADGKGIMDLVRFLSPRHVVLVHGEKPKMAKLKGQIESELKILCHYPANDQITLGEEEHKVQFAYCFPVCLSNSEEMQSYEGICRVEQGTVDDPDLNLPCSLYAYCFPP
ncbi:hypothetical protein ACLOJK_023635 [Asimina triloba]